MNECLVCLEDTCNSSLSHLDGHVISSSHVGRWEPPVLDPDNGMYHHADIPPWQESSQMMREVRMRLHKMDSLVDGKTAGWCRRRNPSLHAAKRITNSSTPLQSKRKSTRAIRYLIVNHPEAPPLIDTLLYKLCAGLCGPDNVSSRHQESMHVS
ncbi:hypothetical protein LX32DRAFT_646785 [Colletotrichum zoysiae]|uniref:Uncharacterized protein n=1 Tax=Colletotrichum zoysiae TaxID=1216348 RepID=A0AAD9LTW5_9PEZI|nr:hypothetical protein LX32DRAFT_646785 [Colletotrichum zoysiae]